MFILVPLMGSFFSPTCVLDICNLLFMVFQLQLEFGERDMVHWVLQKKC